MDAVRCCVYRNGTRNGDISAAGRASERGSPTRLCNRGGIRSLIYVVAKFTRSSRNGSKAKVLAAKDGCVPPSQLGLTGGRRF